MKYGLLSKHLFQRAQQHDSCKNLLGNKDLCEKFLYQIITWKKEHSSKQAVPTHSWEKKFFSCYFRRFVRRFFSDKVKKLVV